MAGLKMINLGHPRGRPSITLSKLIAPIGRCNNFHFKRNFCLKALSTLPEFKAAMDFDRLGNFSQSMPLYQRTHEVLSSSTGADSDMSVHVAIQLAKSYIHAAQFKQAEKIFLSAPFSLNTGCVMNVIKGQQYMSTIFLLQGNSSRAAEAVEVALSLCEAQDNKDIDITVHSVSYSLKGLSCIYSGNMNDAEQYLQMAARWSQSPKESAITLNNLGTLSYMKLGHALREKNEAKNITNRDLLYFSKKCIIDRPILSNIQLNLLNDAINYWEEAVEESSADKDAVNNSQQNAAAMCGVNIPVGDISMNISSTASLSAPTNPIGMEVRKIPNSKGVNNKKKKNEDGNDILSTRLQDVHFAINYTNILCNLAVGRSLLSAHQHTPTASEASSSEKEKNNNSKDDSKENNGETVSVTHVTPKQYEEQQSEQIKISVELLSSAIKALESHIEGSSSNSNRKTGHNDVGVNQVEAEVEVNSTAATNTLIIAPTLGRALGQLGLLYLHPFRGTHPEPVFAEGLFRAALDKLNGPYAVRDKRYLYERAVVTRDYGVLLTKWDKREESGHNMIRDADIIFDMLASGDAADGDVDGSGESEMLTSMMLLPIEIYTSGV